jgi:cytoskeletal protein RodZ
MANSSGAPIKESLLLIFVALSILLIVLIWVEGVQSQQPLSLDGLGSTLSLPTQSQVKHSTPIPSEQSAPIIKETHTSSSPATITATLDITAVETSQAGMSDNLLDK